MAVRLAPEPLGTAADSRDRRLQSVRRLDWRFLLPDPHLGRVGYLGPCEHPLLDALRDESACDQLVMVDAPGSRDVRRRMPRGATFDVVVAASPSEATLGRAAALLHAGGWLYAELGTRPSWRTRSRPTEAACGVVRACALLHRSGCVDVEAHWHHPDFERCGWMLPIDGAAVGAYLAPRNVGRLLAPLVARIGGPALRVAHAARLVSSVSVVARRGGGT